MLNINFVPDDYVQKRRLYQANILYIVLLLIVLFVAGGVFLVIKTRQRSLFAEVSVINAKLAKTSEAIAQLEELQSKRKIMMKTALMTAQLIEPVPRSLLLAELANSLPAGVSLTRVKFVQKAQAEAGAAYSSKYEAAKAAAGAEQGQLSLEKMLETEIEIEGLAPSDEEVAGYIARLSDSILFEDVDLVHSKEHKVDEEIFRKFELTAMLKKDVHITKEDITKIAARRLSQ